MGIEESLEELVKKRNSLQETIGSLKPVIDNYADELLSLLQNRDFLELYGMVPEQRIGRWEDGAVTGFLRGEDFVALAFSYENRKELDYEYFLAVHRNDETTLYHTFNHMSPSELLPGIKGWSAEDALPSEELKILEGERKDSLLYRFETALHDLTNNTVAEYAMMEEEYQQDIDTLQKRTEALRAFSETYL